jgi:hypothetical protein
VSVKTGSPKIRSSIKEEIRCALPREGGGNGDHAVS